jgi:glycosyltransferase involved in cell wall biosynthesis
VNAIRLRRRAPTVSVLIPCYNGARFLRRAIDSARAQRYPRDRLQIVVIDDGSSDDSHRIATELAREDPRILALRQDNAGPAAARNFGIARSSGELIAFLDCDDTWAPDKLVRQARLMRDDPGLGLVHCGCRFVDADGAEVKGWVRPSRPVEGWALLELFCDFFLITSAVLVRRQALEAAGGFDPALRVGEDYDLFLRLLARFPLGCVPAPLLHRTIRPDSLSRLDYDLDARNDLMLLQRFLDAHPEFARRHRDRIRARFAGYYYDYGYRLLEDGELPRARAALAQSLRRRPSLPAARALLRSLLPRATWSLLRA